MHAELQALLDAAAVLKKVEDVLARLGVRSADDIGGMASGDFGRQYGPDGDVHLAWHLFGEMEVDEDAATQEVGPVDYVVSAALFFDPNSVFVVAYEEADDEWGVFLESTEADLKEVSPSARAFAREFGVTTLDADDDDPMVISEERAFEVIEAMAVYVLRHAGVGAARGTATGGPLN